MHEIVVRKAKDEDLALLQEMSEELTVSDSEYDTRLEKDWAYTTYGEKYLKSRILANKCICLIVEVDGKPAGYATGAVIKTLTWRKVKRVQLENLLIREKFRNQGIGAKLIDTFVSWGKEMGAERIMVEAYFSNTGAINFYKKSEFIENDLILERMI